MIVIMTDSHFMIPVRNSFNARSDKFNLIIHRRNRKCQKSENWKVLKILKMQSIMVPQRIVSNFLYGYKDYVTTNVFNSICSQNCRKFAFCFEVAFSVF